jgi:benzil reductase ((S)-benzoin forming)
MKCYFITGVSSGIGAALVKELLASSEDILIKGCSRRRSEIQDLRFVSYQSDLCSISDRAALATNFFDDIPSNVSSLILINNAGSIGTIGSVGTVPNESHEEVITTNLIAPAFLSEEFIKRFQYLPIPKVILNISSGAANKDYEGWAAYCASKAGLERFTTVVAAEQAKQAFPVKMQAFAPGVIDTPMQETIRRATSADFPSVNRFLELHKNNSLLKPNIAAAPILQMVLQLEAI